MENMNKLKSKASRFFRDAPTKDEEAALAEGSFDAGIDPSLKKPSRFWKRGEKADKELDEKPLPTPTPLSTLPPYSPSSPLPSMPPMIPMTPMPPMSPIEGLTALPPVPRLTPVRALPKSRPLIPEGNPMTFGDYDKPLPPTPTLELSATLGSPNAFEKTLKKQSKLQKRPNMKTPPDTPVTRTSSSELTASVLSTPKSPGLKSKRSIPSLRSKCSTATLKSKSSFASLRSKSSTLFGGQKTPRAESPPPVPQIPIEFLSSPAGTVTTTISADNSPYHPKLQKPQRSTGQSTYPSPSFSLPYDSPLQQRCTSEQKTPVKTPVKSERRASTKSPPSTSRNFIQGARTLTPLEFKSTRTSGSSGNFMLRARTHSPPPPRRAQISVDPSVALPKGDQYKRWRRRPKTTIVPARSVISRPILLPQPSDVSPAIFARHSFIRPEGLVPRRPTRCPSIDVEALALMRDGVTRTALPMKLHNTIPKPKSGSCPPSVSSRLLVDPIHLPTTYTPFNLTQMVQYEAADRDQYRVRGSRYMAEYFHGIAHHERHQWDTTGSHDTPIELIRDLPGTVVGEWFLEQRVRKGAAPGMLFRDATGMRHFIPDI